MSGAYIRGFLHGDLEGFLEVGFERVVMRGALPDGCWVLNYIPILGFNA